MKLLIPKDIFDNPKPPRLFLCTTGKKKIGQLPAYDVQLTGKWGSYSELTFSIDRVFTDALTGELRVNTLFDKAEGLRMVLVEGIGYFTIRYTATIFIAHPSVKLPQIFLARHQNTPGISTQGQNSMNLLH